MDFGLQYDAAIEAVSRALGEDDAQVQLAAATCLLHLTREVQDCGDEDPTARQVRIPLEQPYVTLFIFECACSHVLVGP